MGLTVTTVDVRNFVEFQRLMKPSDGVLEDWGISVNQFFENRQIPPFRLTKFHPSECKSTS